MNMEDKILWSKPSFDVSFVKNELTFWFTHTGVSHMCLGEGWCSNENLLSAMGQLWEFQQHAGVSGTPSLQFPLILSITDVWEVWQCPSHTLETEMRRYGARSRGTRQEWNRRPHPATYFQ